MLMYIMLMLLCFFECMSGRIISRIHELIFLEVTRVLGSEFIGHILFTNGIRGLRYQDLMCIL